MLTVRLQTACVALLVTLAGHELLAQTVAPNHGVRPRRMVIRNAMLVEGNGTPAGGPKDIVKPDSARCRRCNTPR